MVARKQEGAWLLPPSSVERGEHSITAVGYGVSGIAGRKGKFLLFNYASTAH